jgi:glyoxylase-like metal-dependent hydrolase (beta-lactamase superfamily II)
MADSSFTKVTPHIARLDLSKGGKVSIYLVQGTAEEGWSLVDTGYESQVDAVMQAVLAFTKGQKPHRLILTHGHPDHAGGALKIRNTWDLKVAAGRPEIEYLTDPVFYRKIKAHTPMHYVTFLLAQPAMLGRGVDLPLDNKSVIAGMTATLTEGHAPGHVALLHKADRALICGDVFRTQNGVGDPPGNTTYNPSLNHQGQARLSLLDFDHLLPAHGAPLMNNARQQAQAWAEKQLGKEKFAKLQAAQAK